MPDNATADVLDHPVFTELPPAQRTLVGERVSARTLPADAIVFRAGDHCQGLPVVLNGMVRVQMTGASGHEIVLYRIGDNDICTLSIGCLMAGRGYRAEAIADTETTAAIVPYDIFQQLMAESGAFRNHIMTTYGERLDALMLLVEEVAFQRMDVRLANWLREHARGGYLAMTHGEVAAELGTAREVVSRLLKDFEHQGWLRLGRGRIELL